MPRAICLRTSSRRLRAVNLETRMLVLDRRCPAHRVQEDVHNGSAKSVLRKLLEF